MTEKTALPPISSLFKDSWEEFKKSFIKLLLLFLLSVGLYIAAGVIFALIFFALGAGSFFSNPSLGIAAALTNPISLIGFIITMVIAVIAFILIGMTFQVATMRLIYHPNKEESIITLLKTSFPLIAPVFAVSLLSGLLALGGFGLLIVPGILFSFLFSFSIYEVLFNQQKSIINALRRSYALFTTNFWGILGRVLLMAAISTVITIAISRNDNSGILAAIVNTLLGWFSLCYGIALYKQVAKGNEHLPGKNIKGIVIASLAGYLLLILLIFGMANAAKNLPQINNSMDIQNNSMPSEMEMQQMLEQLPEGESMPFEDQAI